MIRWIKVLILSLLGAVSLYAESGEGESLWLLQQDFIKFGKKEVYEAAQKQLVKDFGKKPSYTTFALQDDSNPEYLYFTSVKTYAGLDAYLKLLQKNQNASSDQATLRANCLSFVLRTLYLSLPSCSSLPQGKTDLLTSGFASYFLFGITPGEELVFEQHLMEMVAHQKSLETPTFWRAWKVIIGGDQPRYMIVIFNSTQKQASENAEGIEFITRPIKQILRKEKTGTAVIRSDLSSKFSLQ